MNDLVQAIKRGRKWIDGLTRYSYSDAFGAYKDTYLNMYTDVLDSCESTQSLAQTFVDGVEESWKKEKFWNRSAAKVDDKMVLTCFLTPMLMDTGTKGVQFAKDICEAWNIKWPKNGYEMADYETIANGFRHSILGIDLDNKHLDKNKDKQ